MVDFLEYGKRVLSEYDGYETPFVAGVYALISLAESAAQIAAELKRANDEIEGIENE